MPGGGSRPPSSPSWGQQVSGGAAVCVKIWGHPPAAAHHPGTDRGDTMSGTLRSTRCPHPCRTHTLGRGQATAPWGTHTPVPCVPAGAHGLPAQPALRGDVGGSALRGWGWGSCRGLRPWPERMLPPLPAALLCP